MIPDKVRIAAIGALAAVLIIILTVGHATTPEWVMKTVVGGFAATIGFQPVWSAVGATVKRVFRIDQPQ